jgi:energy-coupling factor transport system substrate-specific component|tara:strand:- start:602 stop:1258 length:657 start_codon:yes stop_codon:yes gene_type:complete
MIDAHAINLGPNGMLLVNVALLSMIGWALLKTEKNLTSQSDVIILALIGIFAISGRILLDPIPNIQPVTFIVLLTGIHFGATRSIILATSIALISNLFLGHGLWTIYQALGWSLVGILGSIISSKIYSNNTLSINPLMPIAVLCGFVFDWVVSLSVLHAIGPDMFLLYILSGIPFDILHAAGNMFFIAWLAIPLSEIMTRHISISQPSVVDNFAKVRV